MMVPHAEANLNGVMEPLFLYVRQSGEYASSRCETDLLKLGSCLNSSEKKVYDCYDFSVKLNSGSQGVFFLSKLHIPLPFFCHTCV